MKKVFFLLLICGLCWSCVVNPQTFQKNEIDSVQWKIYDFLQTHQKDQYDSTKSEVILVIIATNDKSRLATVNLLSDDKNKGVLYELLSQMTVADFKGWFPKNFTNGTIMVPVYSTRIHSASNYA